jgi:hypothetical protein
MTESRSGVTTDVVGTLAAREDVVITGCRGNRRPRDPLPPVALYTGGTVITRLVHAEIPKLSSTLSARVTIAAAVSAAPVLTVVNTYTASTHGQPPLTTPDGLHHVLNSGVLVAMVMLGLGIVCMAGEHRHGTIVPTSSPNPGAYR